MTWEPTEKQEQALDLLEDRETTELFFGGGAGGGKSTLGCVWLIKSCLQHQGTRWLMGRAVLKSLKDSTLLTFFQLCAKWNLKNGVDYEYHVMGGVIRFMNGSEIYLKDLFAYPSDPEFDELGSTEYTGAFIDEGSQVTVKAKNIVMSRIRYKLEENNLIPKLLIASNPSKNFLYYDFYKPWKDGALPKYRKFVQALAKDNPYISKFYIENLSKLDSVSRERLLFGNFEYDDDPSKLIEYGSILSMFTNSPRISEQRYLSVDVARFGSDNIVMASWKGLHVDRIHTFRGLSVEQTKAKISEIAAAEQIQRSKIVIDEDGVGGGVVDGLPGVVGFLNGGRPLERVGAAANYQNLKSQCYFYLADYINTGKISCGPGMDAKAKAALIEDLEQVKRKDIDRDGKLAVVSKEQVKERLGRSCDYSDALMMRMIFEIRKPQNMSMIGTSTSTHEGLDFSLGRRV